MKDQWSLLRVYKSSFPDEEIEAALNDLLISISRNSADPGRRYIVEALQDNGTEAILPALNMLFEDINPSAKVRTLFSQHLDLIDKMSAKADLSFVQIVSEVIEKIEYRKKNTKRTKEPILKDDHSKTELEDYLDHLSKAEKYLQSDPETSVFWLRKSAENLAKAVSGGCRARRFQLDGWKFQGSRSSIRA